MHTGNMDKDLKCLVPEIVADSYALDRNEANLLVAKAKRIYALNPQWGKRITDTNKGRDLLHMFMQHWHEAFVKTGDMK